jgi:O-antigen ligase
VAAARPLRQAAGDAALGAFFLALAGSISAAQILLAVLVVLAVLRGRAARRAAARGPAAAPALAPAGPILRHPLTAPFAAFTALTLLSALFSGDPAWSLWIARDTCRIATVYVVLALTRDAAQAFRLWQGFIVALTLMAVYGLGQAYVCTVRPPGLSAGWLAAICTHPERVRGPFSIYMTFGGVLLLGALVVLACLASVPWRRVWWLVPAGAVTTAALVLTQSRNAWLGLCVGGLGLVATARRAGRIVLVLATVVLVTAAVAPGTVAERARSLVDPRDRTLLDRLAMWRSGLEMIADHPLLGVGPGEVRAWYGHYRRPEAIRPSTGHLHNSAIQIAAERGLPALVVWIWLWVAFFRAGIPVLRRTGREPPHRRALVSASLAGVVGFLVAGLFEHNFGDGEVVMVVYALMALPFVVARELPGAPPDPAGASAGGSARPAPGPAGAARASGVAEAVDDR